MKMNIVIATFVMTFGPGNYPGQEKRGRQLSKQDRKAIRQFKRRELHGSIHKITVQDCLWIILMNTTVEKKNWGTRVYFDDSFFKYVPSWLMTRVQEKYQAIKKERGQIELKMIEGYRSPPWPPPRSQFPSYNEDEQAFVDYMDKIVVAIYPPKNATPFTSQEKYELWKLKYSSQNSFPSVATDSYKRRTQPR